MRREFPSAVKRAAWDRCAGRCESCTAKLFPGKFAFDHILPDGLGGEPTLANCQVLCSACHAAKTHRADRPRMAKADRSAKRHLGLTKPKHPMPGSRNSKWKRRMDGTVERRGTP